MAKKISDLNEKDTLNQDGDDLFEIEQITPSAGSFRTPLSAILARAKRNQTIVINSIDDFPDPIGGVITLVANTEYLISGTINFGTNRLQGASGVVFTGIATDQSVFIYTGTSAFYTGVNVGIDISKITISCPNAIIFSFDSSATNLGACIFDQLLITSGIGVATLDSVVAVGFFRCTILGITGSSGAIQLAGNIVGFAITQSFLTQSTFTGAWVDLGSSQILSTFDFVSNVIDIGNGQFGISGLVSSGNFTTGLLTSTTTNYNTSGTGQALENISQNDNRAVFFVNQGVPDSSIIGTMTISGNSTNTVISTINVPVKAAGTWSAGPLARFSFASNTLTYTGSRDVENVQVVTSCTINTSGTNQTIGITVYQNGVEITETRATVELDGGDMGRVTNIWVTDIQPGDTFEMFVVNETSTNDVLLSSGSFLI